MTARPARPLRIIILTLLAALGCRGGNAVFTEESKARQDKTIQAISAEAPKGEEPWVKPIPVPADAELEQQIRDVQEALKTIYEQMVRHAEALKNAPDAATRAQLSEELEELRTERDGLEKLLHHLIDEAKLSERTAIDEALARARWLERQQEQWQQKEEAIRDRQR